MKKKNSNGASMGGTRIVSGDIAKATTSIDPSALSPWSFAERRKIDRRQHDRRRYQNARIDLLALDASHRCTARERQIVLLLLQGLTNKEIAQRLGIVEDTVKKHLQHVYCKLGIRRRALLILEQTGGMKRKPSGQRRSAAFVK